MMNSEHLAGYGRHVSRLARDTLALVLAGGKGSRLYELTDWRAKPAVYFGGNLRIIDFPLSNCVNSGIRRMGVLTQYKAHSLIRHLIHGWASLQSGKREFLEILPASQRVGGEWYLGTADAIYQNLDIIRTHRPKLVLVLSGDHVYKMDYGPLLAFHDEAQADMTVCCLEVPIKEAAGQLGVMTVDETGQVIAFHEKPENPAPLPGSEDTCLASMGNYVFNTAFLYEQVIKDADDPDSDRDFGKNVIPGIIDNYRVFAYPFRDRDTGKQAYWRDVGTLDSFWRANLELTWVDPPLNLYDLQWPIITNLEQLPPAKFIFDDDRRQGVATESMVASGAIISGGKVKKSLLFTNCHVHSYALVENSVVLPGCEVKGNTRIKNAIIDRGSVIPEGMEIGLDHEQDRARGFRVTEGGITLVTPDMLGQRLHHTR